LIDITHGCDTIPIKLFQSEPEATMKKFALVGIAFSLSMMSTNAIAEDDATRDLRAIVKKVEQNSKKEEKLRPSQTQQGPTSSGTIAPATGASGKTIQPQ